MTAQAQLILDYGSRILTALLVRPDGELLPCSEEIRDVTVRHVPSELFVDPRAAEERGFSWEDALEAAGTASPRNFFQRARRLGIRRLWELEAEAPALQLASPFALLSSAAALTDRELGGVLPGIAATLLRAQLEPLFAFITGHGIAVAEVQPIVILPAHAGRRGRMVLQAVLRRRGFARPVIVRRELAAAMSLLDSAPCECRVWDITDDDLHLHTVAIERAGDERRLRTTRSQTLRGFGRAYFTQQIAASLSASASAVDRSLTSLLTRVAEPPLRITHGVLQDALGQEWERERVAEIAAALPAGDERSRIVVTGDLCALEPVRNVFASLGAAGDSVVPVLDRLVRNTAAAILWQRGSRGRRLAMPPSGSLRINGFSGEALELLTAAQLPGAGEDAHFSSDFRIAGDGADRSFLLHVVWGTDAAPEGNATLCAAALDRQAVPADESSLRLVVRLRRSSDGRRLRGCVNARINGSDAASRVAFTEEFAGFPWKAEEMR